MTGRPVIRIVLSAWMSLACLAGTSAQEESTGIWNGKKCAVSLTYDDGLNVHLDRVIPALDSMGMKGTFYLTGFRDGVGKRINDWRAAAGNWHELGNHTLFHPCIAVANGRDYSDWVKPEYDLNGYTITRMTDEIKMANIFLNAIDGKNTRTIAYPCGDCFIQDSSYVPFIRNDMAGGRGGSGYNTILGTDIYRIASIGVDDHYSGEQLIGIVQKAQKTETLVVICFHGVGGEHRTDISFGKHNMLLRYLKENETRIWVAPLVEVAEYIREYKERPAAPDQGARGRGAVQPSQSMR